MQIERPLLDEWLDRSGRLLDEIEIAAARAIADMPTKSNAFAGSVEIIPPVTSAHTPHYEYHPEDE